LLFVLAACSKPEATLVFEENSPDTFKTFEVDIKSSQVALSELIAEVEVLHLEETEASLLSYANRVATYEDKLVFPSGRNGEIFVYSNTGKFIRKFTHKGDGPGEYSDLKSLWLNADTIMVFNHEKQSLLYYDIQGVHLKTVRFNSQPTHVYTYKEDFLMEMSFEAIEDSLQYRLLVQDKNLEKKGLYVPYQKALPFPVYSNISAFKPYLDKVVFQPAFHDTVYLVGPNGVAPFFNIDFGEDYFWADESLFDHPDGAMSQLGVRNQVWIFNTFVGEKQMIINFNTSYQDFYQGIVDRQTGRYARFDMRKSPEKDYLLMVVKVEGDRFLFNLPSSELADFIEEIGIDKVKFKAGSSMEQIEGSENPVLLWVSFKALL